MTWYKVTRMNGSSFHDPTVTYEAGRRVRPKPHSGDRKLCGEGTLHASPSAPEAMRYGKWPCRLFEVEGTPFVEDSDKAGFRQLRVKQELDAWRVFGPNGRHVEAVLGRIAVCTPDEIDRLAAAQYAAQGAAWDAAQAAAQYAAWGAAWGVALGAARDAALGAAWDAAWEAAQYAAQEAAWGTAQDAARNAALGAAWDAAWEAAWGAARYAVWGTAQDAAWDAAREAAIVDLIGQYGYTQTHHDLLTGPWKEVIGVWNGTEWEKER